MTHSNENSPRPGSAPGPDDVTRVELPNGITVLARSNFNSPSVVMHGYLWAGSLFDPDEKLGLADFSTSALMRGTQSRDFQGIYEALESVGASLGVSARSYTTGFGGRALAEDLSLLLTLLSEVLRQPTFPEEQVERLRAQMLTGLALRAQNTGAMAAQTFDEMVYAGHPYSRLEEGTPESIQAITREDLAAYSQKHFGPRGLTVSVVGAVEPAQAVELVRHTLGDWENPDQPEIPALPDLTPLEEVTTRRVEIPGKSQADLVMGTSGPPRRSPDFLAASLGNNVLGRFGMYGRIGAAVREQAGLAYYAYSSLSGGFGPGPWYVSAGVNAENVDRAVDLAREEIRRFIAEPVDAEELSDSQANYVGRMPLSLESNSGVAGALLNIERHNLGLDYYLRYPGLIDSITTEDVLAAARQYLDPDRMAVAIAGTLED